MKLLSTLSLAGLFAASSVLTAQTVPSAVSDLEIWLTDAAATFDGTTWLDSSGNGFNATAVGFRAGSDPTEFPDTTYVAGTLDTQFGASGIAFSGSADDLMKAGNSFSGRTDITIITVYSTSLADSEVRTVGLGSQAEKGAASTGLFNLATDGSLRYDNGNNTGAANATGQLLVRAARLDSGTVTNWMYSGGLLASTIGPTSTPNGGTIPNGLGADADGLYLGDVRAGSTRVGGPGSGTFNSADLFISQIAVFNRALSDFEVGEVTSWMAANPSAIPEPSTYAVIFGALGLGFAVWRRRR